jgi:hypothetical protein
VGTTAPGQALGDLVPLGDIAGVVDQEIEGGAGVVVDPPTYSCIDVDVGQRSGGAVGVRHLGSSRVRHRDR